jgi:hypothetical protein
MSVTASGSQLGVAGCGLLRSGSAGLDFQKGNLRPYFCHCIIPSKVADPRTFPVLHPATTRARHARRALARLPRARPASLGRRGQRAALRLVFHPPDALTETTRALQVSLSEPKRWKRARTGPLRARISRNQPPPRLFKITIKPPLLLFDSNSRHL